MMYALLAIVIVAPFERALVTTPGGFTLTTVEAVVFVAVAVLMIGMGPRAVAGQFRNPAAFPGLVFLAALAIAAFLSPVDQANAARFVLRMLLAALLIVTVRHTVSSRQRARLVVRTMVFIATLVAAVALLEAMQVAVVLSALTTFRPGFHVVAGQLRATSTLFYPTITSMYLELAFVCGLWLLLDPGRRRSTLERALVFLALVLIAAGISATFTRTGLVAMAVAIVGAAAISLLRVPRTHAGLGLLTTLAGAVTAVVFVGHSPELLATRLRTEGSEAWYGAQYGVPKTLALRTGAVHRVPVVLTNTGRFAWNSSEEPAFALSYHWLRAGSDVVIEFEGRRTPFPQVVEPRTTVRFDADVIAPREPGEYTLVWDVVHETRAWLSTQGVEAPRTRVTVRGAPTGTVEARMDRLPGPSIRPARPALWAAALRLSLERPFFGIGPDNYRLVYGSYLDLDRWDRSVHANNMYLEVLAGAGIIGLGTFLWLLTSTGRLLWQRVQRASASAHMGATVAFIAWVVVAGHGLVDSFLSFTTTYVMFAVAAGVATSTGFTTAMDSNAHRV